MRLDRILTLSVARPLVGSGLMSRGRTLPILMYHSISADSQSGVSPYYKTATSPEVFEQQVRALSAAGYKSVRLDGAVRMLQSGAELEKAVVITFDDGFRDFYDLAFPILKHHGHTASMFLPTAFIGNDRRSFKEHECLVWSEVRELHAAGIEFGSHTVNHPKLHELGWQEIENELALSKNRIERELGQPVTSFTYPYAFPQQNRRFTERFAKLLQSVGYFACATTVVGRARPGDDVFSLKRLPVNVCDDLSFFDAKLNGAYDWLAYPQGCYKAVRHRFSRTTMSPTPARSTPHTF